LKAWRHSNSGPGVKYELDFAVSCHPHSYFPTGSSSFYGRSLSRYPYKELELGGD
jgi:hypothetical protein